jgi:hypothetical protein
LYSKISPSNFEYFLNCFALIWKGENKFVNMAEILAMPKWKQFFDIGLVEDRTKNRAKRSRGQKQKQNLVES